MKAPRRVQRPELPRTQQQLIAHACADALATTYSKATVEIGLEQASIRMRNGEIFVVLVKRAAP